jgi:hypothetical protein
MHLVSDDDKRNIREACRVLAMAQLGRGKPGFADAAHVERLTDALLMQATLVAGCTACDDAAIIARATRYIAHTHATGQHAEHPGYLIEQTDWFFAMLMALVELACPNAGQTPESEQFFRDIEHGIAEARCDYCGD